MYKKGELTGFGWFVFGLLIFTVIICAIAIGIPMLLGASKSLGSAMDFSQMIPE